MISELEKLLGKIEQEMYEDIVYGTEDEQLEEIVERLLGERVYFF